MTLYMKVTKDEYELPIAVAETQAELAHMLGVKPMLVYNGIRSIRTGQVKHSSYKIVEVEDE